MYRCRWRGRVRGGWHGLRLGFCGGRVKCRRDSDEFLRARCVPNIEATRAAQRAAALADQVGFDLIGRCAVWAGEQHGMNCDGRFFGSDHRHESVNGSETIRMQMLPAVAWVLEVNEVLTARLGPAFPLFW